MVMRYSNIKRRARCSAYLIACGIFLLLGCEQDPAPIVLAEVANHQITSTDFLPRFRDFILTSGSDDSPRVRDQVLNNMINEYLLADYTDQLGLAKGKQFDLRADRRKRQAILAAYRRHMIDNQVTLTEEELRKGFAQFNERLRARHLYAADRATADSIYAQLEKGESFHSLARTTFSDPLLASTGGDLGFFGMGDMDPAFEEAAFTTPAGSYSQPVETDYGYSIIKVEDRRRMPMITETQFAEQKKHIRRYLKWKKTVLHERAFLTGLIESTDVVYHPEGLQQLADIITGALGSEDGDSLMFRPGQELPESVLQKPCLTTEDIRWDVATTLEHLGELQLGQVRRGQTSVGVKNILRGLLARELMLADALKNDFDEQKQVVRSASAAIRLEKLHVLQNALYDTVTVPQIAIRDHHSQFRDQFYFPDEANVQLLMVRDSIRAQTISGQLRKGADFTSLILKWSQWPDSDKHQGKLGWVPRGKFGDWSEAIFTAKKGEVLGPKKIEDGWFFVRLLDLKPRRNMSLAEAAPQITETLRALRQKEVFRDLINELRSQTEWTIHTETVNELSLI